MKTGKVIFLISVFILKISLCIACSCERLYFCEYLKNTDKKVVFEATVVNYKEYSTLNTAVYLKITRIYRDDVGLTEIIKLYGSRQEADCHIDFVNTFKLGANLLIAIGLEYSGQDAGFHIVNPDDIYEDFWEFAPHLCLAIVLTKKDDKIFGPIAPSIFEYPSEIFEERLENCNFSLDELDNYRCADTDYLIYPNPSEDGKVKIVNGFKYSSIDQIKIFTIDGKLLFSMNYHNDPFQRTEIDLKHSGIFIIEITCNEKISYRKFVVE